MAYAYEIVKNQIGFDYANIDNPDFLASLRYVRNENNRLIYVVRFPNSPIKYEDSLILVLQDGKLRIHNNRQYTDGETQVTQATVTDLVQNFPYIGVYDKFVASCFMACAREFV